MRERVLRAVDEKNGEKGFWKQQSFRHEMVTRDGTTVLYKSEEVRFR